METNLDILYKKLEEFISKFHLYKVVKGFFLLIVLYLFIFLLQSVIEYFNYLSVEVKSVLFYITLTISFFLLIFFLLIPVASLIHINRRLDFKKASKIISKHFPEMEDKLLNTLELSENLKFSNYNHDLVIASINQRIFQLNPFPFKNAINFSYFKRNFILFVISISMLLVVFAFNPGIVTDGSVRLFNYSTHYEPNAPFRFIIEEKSLFCEKNKDFVINLRIEGDYIPENVYVTIGENQFLMNKAKRKGLYNFTLRNLNNSVEFKLFADKFYSKIYQINVLPAPLIRSISLEVFPPSNTNISPFKIINSGDCSVPSGSKIDWNIQTSFVDSIQFIINKDSIGLASINSLFKFKKQISSNSFYTIHYFNRYFKSGSDLKYSITVVPDQYPEIEIKQFEDSSEIGSYYFVINIKDDYGFKDLRFMRKDSDSDTSKLNTISVIQIPRDDLNQDLIFQYNFNDLKDISDNSFIEFFFEVRDNDFLNGYKAARSTSKTYKLLNKDEVRKAIDEAENGRDAALSKTKKLTNDIQNEIDQFKKKELNSELTEWEKKNFLKSITDKQKQLDKFVEDIIDNNKKSNQINNQFYDEQKNILEKQKQIQEILDRIMNDELKNLLKEIEELSEKFNQQQFEKLKDKMDFSYKNLENKLDRSLELLKRYQVEESVLKVAEDIDKLSEDQKKLSNEEYKKDERSDLLKKQSEIQEEFKKIENEFKETQIKNKDLKSPYSIDQFDKEFNQNNKQLDELKEEIPSGNKKKIQQKQEQISKELSKISESMKNMFKEMEQETTEMNIGELRQIIDNLSTFSFSQEDNYMNSNKNIQNSPAFPNLTSQQVKLSDDFKVIDDSLRTLMNKVPQLGDLMLKEVENIDFNLNKANKLMEQRNRREALKVQRFILNSSNTLSLLLGELKDQLENQMQNGGTGDSKKQGKPQQAMQELKNQQQKLKEQLEKLLEEMKKDGGKQDGKGLNDQIVKTLAEHEIFNKMLNDLQNQQGINPETDKKLKEIKRLSDQNIEDLINKKIGSELFNRNQKILTRLLESEKSDQEREQEKKRESKEGNKKEFVIPEELRESIKKEKNFREMLQKSNLNMKSYYKNLSNAYFRNISN